MITRTVVRTLIALATLFSGLAVAGGSGTGKIVPGWLLYPGGIIFFYIDGPNGGHANSACPLIPTRWAIDTTTQDGKTAFAMLMLSYSQDRTVAVYGHDGVPCIHGNTEVASQVHVY